VGRSTTLYNTIIEKNGKNGQVIIGELNKKSMYNLMPKHKALFGDVVTETTM